MPTLLTKCLDFNLGKEFVRFQGTICGKEYQYRNFDSFEKAKIACASDQNCIAFYAIQTYCPEYRKACHAKGKLDLTKDGDFGLCKRNATFKHEKLLSLREYHQRMEGNVCEDDCFHDVYIKSNEPGKSMNLLTSKIFIKMFKDYQH